jgi:hypothetical protein
MSSSPSPSPTLSRILTRTITPTPSASVRVSTNVAASTPGLSTDGQTAVIVVFSFIFLGSIAFVLWLWRRRQASTSGQFASPRDALFMPRQGANAAAASGGANNNIVLRWLAEAKSRLCPLARNSGAASTGPNRAGPAASGPAAPVGSSAPAIIESQAQSSLPRSQNPGNPSSVRAPPQAKTLYERIIGSFFSNTAARPPREMRANNLPINLSSRNFQVSNPLASSRK